MAREVSKSATGIASNNVEGGGCGRFSESAIVGMRVKVRDAGDSALENEEDR